MNEDRSTMIRANQSTIDAMRLATNQLSVDAGIFYPTDDDRLKALVEYFNTTQGTTDRPVLLREPTS